MHVTEGELMQHFLYVLRVTRLGQLTEGPTEREEQIVSDHFDYLMDLGERGVMLLFGRTTENDERTFGIAVFQVESEHEAQAIMENDPAVKNGVMRAALHPYRIAFMKGVVEPITSP
jgi:uncharacterized protein YciI